MNYKEADKRYIANTYNRFPVVLVKGKGSEVWDEDGKRYIDLSGGIAVNSFGFADEEWLVAVTEQLSTLPHTSNLFYSKPNILLAEKLCTLTGMKKVFFSNSGAEANECAIKVARKYAAEKHGSEYYHIVTLINSFHGRTLTTLAATGQESFHQEFTPLTPGFVHTAANDIKALRTAVETHKCAAIMIEPIQGEGGVMALEADFVKAAAALAHEKDILLICDEVQTGNGRSGALYTYMNYGIMPDVVSTAKGLGGGLPIGATLIGEKAQNVLTPGSHGSTFGGNPAACAGALSILNRIDETLLRSVREKSAYLFEALSGAKGIRSVSGMGFMIGLLTEKPAAEVIAACREKGVLVISAKNKVRLLPALNIPTELLHEAVSVIQSVCAEESEK